MSWRTNYVIINKRSGKVLNISTSKAAKNVAEKNPNVYVQTKHLP